MLETLFENRNRTLSSLIKLGDCLGRSLRENIILFSINSDVNRVIYLAESKKVIIGNYNVSKPVTFLQNIRIEDTELFENSELFNTVVNNQVSDFVGSILNDNLDEANASFTEILSLWENQIKFNNFYDKLCEKSIRFNLTNKIIQEDSFQKFIDAAPQLIEFLRSNKEKLINIPEIENSVRVSNIVSEAFDFPRLTYDELEEEGKYLVPNVINSSVYEIICKQEIIKQELLESKREFDTAWATNDKVRALATLIYNKDSDIANKLSEAFIEVPYIALTTKKQLNKVIINTLKSLSEEISYSTKDIQSFVAKIFEMKKPLKRELLEYINKTYGINIQNLNDVPSFKSLIDTQIVIFETLSRLSQKSSVQKDILLEVASMLKTKTGVESIDVNTYLTAVFDEAGYLDEYEMDSCVESFDIKGSVDKISELNSIVDIIKKGYHIDEAETKEKSKPKAKEDPKTKSSDEEEEPKKSPDNPEGDAATEDELAATSSPEIITKEDFLADIDQLEALLADLQDELEDDGEDSEDKESEEDKEQVKDQGPIGEGKKELKGKSKEKESEEKETKGTEDESEDDDIEDKTDKLKKGIKKVKDKIKKKKKGKNKDKEEPSETEDEQYNEEAK